ncbi:hypothetical protein LT493_31970 [Streptomyces tricolor]|nr:hypothetical protein [Streptomyces tricolor]
MTTGRGTTPAPAAEVRRRDRRTVPPCPPAPARSRRTPSRSTRTRGRGPPTVAHPAGRTAAWPACSTGSPVPDRCWRRAAAPTARDLAVRRRLLLALSALLTLSLFVSYQGVHGDANAARTSSAPAVLSPRHRAARARPGPAGRRRARPDQRLPEADLGRRAELSAAAATTTSADRGPPGPPDDHRTDHRLRRQGPAVPAPAERQRAARGVPQLRDQHPDGEGLRDTGPAEDPATAAARRRAPADLLRPAAVALPWTVTPLLALALGAALLETQLFLRHRSGAATTANSSRPSPCRPRVSSPPCCSPCGSSRGMTDTRQAARLPAARAAHP